MDVVRPVGRYLPHTNQASELLLCEKWLRSAGSKQVFLWISLCILFVGG